MRTKHLFMAGLFIILAACVFPARAQNTDESGKLNLIISSLPINLISKPGSQVTADIRVKNGGSQTENLKIDLMKFSAYDETGKPMLTDREPGDDYFDWVTFSENQFDIAPDQWKTIKATFNVPDKALPGYYYAVVFSRSKETEPASEQVKKLKGAAAVLVLLEVDSPNAKKEITVLEFTSDKKVYEFLPSKFNVKLKNTGNVHVAPRGSIFIDSRKQNDLAILDVNEGGRGNVLPESVRAYTAVWDDGFPVYVNKIENGKVVLDKNGDPVKTLKWDFSQIGKFRWGKYTANLLMIYDDGKRDVPIEGTLQFWVIPWRLIVILILILLFILFGIYFILSRTKRLFSRSKKKDTYDNNRT